MGSVYLLDQTLREGGYTNQFHFGRDNIKEIIRGLEAANIEMIECGFIKTHRYNSDYSLFTSVKQFNPLLVNSTNAVYLAMVENQEHVPLNSLIRSADSIDAIRVSFHEYEIDEALSMIMALKDDGYKVFVQPVGVTSFKKESLHRLIERINVVSPYAFYIVDTLGVLFATAFKNLIDYVNSVLSPNVILGFHSHNNCQMSFANAITLLDLNLERDIIIDSSLLGLGRGAGSIRTEMIALYLNKKCDKDYHIENLLFVLDNYIRPIANVSVLTDSLAFYMSAMNSCHPNYANYLMNCRGVSSTDIFHILNQIEPNKKAIFDKDYIKSLLKSNC